MSWLRSTFPPRCVNASGPAPMSTTVRTDSSTRTSKSSRRRGISHCSSPNPTAGRSLFEVSRLQQRLASAAPATALAINMHLMCTGVVKAMNDRGDDSLNWVFDEVMAGEIFAFGISEPSNDWVLQGSNTEAVPTADGGFELTGVKIFTSLSPVWT